MPLVHPPGLAQADFGEAIGVIGGVEHKIHFFAFDLPQNPPRFALCRTGSSRKSSSKLLLGWKAVPFARRLLRRNKGDAVCRDIGTRIERIVGERQGSKYLRTTRLVEFEGASLHHASSCLLQLVAEKDLGTFGR